MINDGLVALKLIWRYLRFSLTTLTPSLGGVLVKKINIYMKQEITTQFDESFKFD